MDEDTLVIESGARIAVYDDLLSAPRIVEIPPQDVQEFIEAIASSAYDLSHQLGGVLPYSVIREITENFIHAGFSECTVSILDQGNTLRFADQGPGIEKKELVLQPGVSSATGIMKKYIRGVGSGFPIVREYLSTSHGFMSIEDNATEGVVVTIAISKPVEPLIPSQDTRGFSSVPRETIEEPLSFFETEMPDLSPRERQALLLLHEHGLLGPVVLADYLGVSAPTTTRLLQKLQQMGMVESTQQKKRVLTQAGLFYVQRILGSEDLH